MEGKPSQLLLLADEAIYFNQQKRAKKQKGKASS